MRRQVGAEQRLVAAARDILAQHLAQYRLRTNVKITTSSAAEKNRPKIPKITPMPMIAKTVIAGGIETTRAWT